MKQLENFDYYIELNTDIVFIKDINGIFTHCNEAFLKFVDKKRNEVIDKTYYDLFPNEFADIIHFSDLNILKNNKTVISEEIFTKETTIYLHTTKKILYDENNNKIGLFCTARDITAQKEYEMIYQDNIQYLENIAIEYNVTKNLDLLVNSAEKRNKNIKCSILLYDKENDCLAAGSAPTLPKYYNEAIDGLPIGNNVGSCGSAIYNRKRVIVKNIDEHENWQPYLELTKKANLHSCWSEPIFSSNNEVLGAFGMYSDEHKAPSEFELKLISSYAHLAAVAIEKDLNRKISIEQAEKLTQSEETFKMLFDNAPILIDSFDKDGNCVLWNKECEKVFGWTMEDINNSSNPLELFYPDPVIQKDAIDTIITKPEKVFREWNPLNKDGETLTTMWAHNYLPNGEIINVGYDLTGAKQKDKLLYEQTKMASLGEMIGNISHQWRQPLSIITTASTGIILEKEYNMFKEETLVKTCNIINDNAQYLSKTIDDFKNFIKGDRSKKIFNLKDDINSFLHLVDGTIKINHIKMILDLPEDIKIDGYQNELIQCLINIFNNAKDVLIEKEEENRLIFISTSIENNQATIKIKDNGGGIAKEVLPKIFEPYFTTKHKSQGTGLGLHMTYNLIVDGMDGTIEVHNVKFKHDSQEYTGAEFVISLPMS